jgi:hypothetical protein
VLCMVRKGQLSASELLEAAQLLAKE